MDIIGNVLTKIRNAVRADKKVVEMDFSKFNKNFLDILLKEGFIDSVEVLEKEPVNKLVVKLRYDSREKSVIHDLQRISKPSRRIYAGVKKIPRIYNGYGIVVISCSEGLMTGYEAKLKNLGGELVCAVW